MNILGVWVGVAVALASPTEGIEKLLDQERHEQAQQRCERIGGHLSTAEPAIRDLCARAAWFRAADEDTLAGWIRYGQVWADTPYAAPAREQEARLALRALGPEPDAAHIDAYLRNYHDTEAAEAAVAALADAAVEAALADPERAAATARLFPDHPGIARLVQRFPERFASVVIRDDQPEIVFDPPITLSPPPTARWVVAFPGDALLDWEQAAIAHLLELGLPRPWIDAQRSSRRGLRPCPIPGAPWQLGIAAQIGENHTFLPHSGAPGCARSGPALAVVREGQLVALSLSPEVLLQLPQADEAPFLHRADSSAIWHVEAPAAPLLSADAFIQRVGPALLFTPLNGDLPWLERRTHAAGALTLTPEILGSLPLPEGWRLEASGAPLPPQTPSSTPITVYDPTGKRPRLLPPGQVHPLSPLLAHLMELQAPSSPALPALPTTPTQGRRLPVARVEAAELQSLSARLAHEQLPLVLQRAVRLSLRPGSPPQIFFDGAIDDQPVRGILDPLTAGSWRITAWLHPEATADPVIFVEHEGQRFVIWTRADGTTETIWPSTQGFRRVVR